MKQNGDALLTIGRLARIAQVGVSTLRFYEREGLLPRPPRTASNYRLYPTEAVRRIRFVRRAQELGFTLTEIKQLLNLRVAGASTCVHVRQRAEIKIRDIGKRIDSLRRMARALTKLSSACGKKQPNQTCPILDHLEEHL